MWIDFLFCPFAFEFYIYFWLRIFLSTFLTVNLLSSFSLWNVSCPFYFEFVQLLFPFFSTENELGDLFTRVFSTKNKLGDFLRGIFNQKWIRDICYVGFFCHRHRVWGGAVLLAKIDEGEIVFQAVYSVLPCLYCTEWGNIQLPLHGIFSTKML